MEPFTNTNYLTGSNGTWASSNPLVMPVNQQGYAMGAYSWNCHHHLHITDRG